MKRSLITCLLIICCKTLCAQYADLGGGTLKNEIWWFDWANQNVANGASRKFIMDDGLEVTISFSNVAGIPVTPSTMNTWFGSLLIQSYNFSNSNIKPALLTSTSSSDSKFTITVSAKRNGKSVPFSFIAADAESSSPNEQIKLKSSGGNWNSIEFFRNSTQTSNPLINCNSKYITITNTQDVPSFPSNLGQNPILLTDATAQDLDVDVELLRSVYGASAVAFGILESIDRGDLPSGFGYAHHSLSYQSKNSCNYNAPFPELIQIKNLFLGKVAGDADPGENLDDNQVGVDEDAFTLFPDYDGSGTYSLTVPYSNTTGAQAFLSGWLDINNDGVFNSNEMATANLPNSSQSITLSWTGLPSTFLPGDSAKYAFRFRVSSDKDAIKNSVGYAPDGEVEDYFVMIKRSCYVLVTTIADTSICAGDSVMLISKGALYYNWQPSIGLSDASAESPVAFPAFSTTYIVEGSDAKGCKSFDTINLKVNNLPIPVTSSDTSICVAGKAFLWASGGNSYEWTSIDTSGKINGDQISVSPAKNTVYHVKVTDQNNCSITDSVVVYVNVPTQNNLNLMPSAFTPNNDGINDCFGLKYWAQLSELDFSVYNRFGNRVFHTTNQNDCWDGKYKGKDQTSGAFVYVISAKTGCGLINRKGVVTLIR